MRGIKRISVFLILALLAGSLFSLTQALRNPVRLQGALVAQIEKRLGARLTLQKADIVFAPFPLLRLEKPRLESLTREFQPLTAEEARFSFRFLPLLWGQFRVSGLRLRNGEGVLWGISLKHMEVKVKGGGPKGGFLLKSKRTDPRKMRLCEARGRSVIKNSRKVSGTI